MLGSAGLAIVQFWFWHRITGGSGMGVASRWGVESRMGVASRWGVEASIHIQKTCSGCYRTVGQQVTGKVLTTSFQGTLPACAFAGGGQRAAAFTIHLKRRSPRPGIHWKSCNRPCNHHKTGTCCPQAYLPELPGHCCPGHQGRRCFC